MTSFSSRVSGPGYSLSQLDNQITKVAEPIAVQARAGEYIATLPASVSTGAGQTAFAIAGIQWIAANVPAGNDTEAIIPQFEFKVGDKVSNLSIYTIATGAGFTGQLQLVRFDIATSTPTTASLALTMNSATAQQHTLNIAGSPLADPGQTYHTVQSGSLYQINFIQATNTDAGPQSLIVVNTMSVVLV